VYGGFLKAPAPCWYDLTYANRSRRCWLYWFSPERQSDIRFL